ncbi:tyrosine-protein phosphatase 69D-like [Neodiprion pinetum]|uniref:tyrosine-protein phosphatase 69D-like n=1 Tax=Neodiprion pinetum TaxID=441929 RepID=UPI001EDCA870|nr:tyrosine-protein phosphatase 69D-like [Neodiprion pinetum]
MKRSDLALILMRLLLFFAILETNPAASKFVYHDVCLEENKPATLYCDIEGSSLTNFEWIQYDDKQFNWSKRNFSTISHMNETYVVMTLEIANVTSGYIGMRYKCSGDAGDSKRRTESAEYRLWTFNEEKSNQNVRAVGKDRIYLKISQVNFIADSLYFLYTGDSSIHCVIEYLANGTTQWQYATSYSWKEIPSYHVIHGLQEETTYMIKDTISNGNEALDEFKRATTLERDIEYVPVITVLKVTESSIAIEWTAPPPELEGYISLYKAWIQDGLIAGWQRVGEESVLSHVFHELHVYSTYNIRVEACSIDECRNKYPSTTMTGVTTEFADVVNPAFTPNVSVNESTNDSITIKWNAPGDSYEGPAIHYYHPILSTPYYADNSVFLNRTTTFYTFVKLRQDVEFQIQVAACGKYRMNCGDPSVPIEVRMPVGMQVIVSNQLRVHTTAYGPSTERNPTKMSKLLEKIAST